MSTRSELQKSRWLTRAKLCLAGTLVLQALGLAASTWADTTSIGAHLFHIQGWSDALTRGIERGAALVALGAAAGAAMVPLRRWRGVPRALVGAGLTASALWLFVDSVVAAIDHQTRWAPLEPAAHAVRYAAPLLALAVFEAARRQVDWRAYIEWCARVAIAATFFAHGLEAWLHHPGFIDFLIVAGDRLLGVRITEPTARPILTVIGAVDMVVAVAALVGARWLRGRVWRALFAYMAFWGLLTAASRVVHWGELGWPKMLVRAANAGIPLLVYLLTSDSDRDRVDSPNRSSGGETPEE